MTDDEVQLIYDYLHENYLYEDGKLIRKYNYRIVYGNFNGNSKKLLFNVSFRVNNKKYNWSYGHLIYVYHHKIKPEYLININGDPTDLRVENLRSTDHSSMMQQCDLKVKNKHGFKGIVKDNNRFGARLWIGKSYKYIGWFATPEEAHAAYLKAKENIDDYK